MAPGSWSILLLQKWYNFRDIPAGFMMKKDLVLNSVAIEYQTMILFLTHSQDKLLMSQNFKGFILFYL